MSNVKLGGLFAPRAGGAEELEALYGVQEAQDGAAAVLLGPLANEALEAFDDGQAQSTTDQWLQSAMNRAQPNKLMEAAAMLDVLSQRIEGEDGQRIRDLCTVVQKYAQLEGLVTIRTSSVKP